MEAPRVRARVGTIEDGPEEIIGKFCFEIWISAMGEGQGKQLGTWGPYDTEEIALEKMKIIVKDVVCQINEHINGVYTSTHIDMKDNEYKNWDEETLH